MTKEQKKKADELEKKISVPRDALDALDKIENHLKLRPTYNLLFKIDASDHYSSVTVSKDLAAVFITLARAEKQKEFEALEAEFNAL